MERCKKWSTLWCSTKISVFNSVYPCGLYSDLKLAREAYTLSIMHANKIYKDPQFFETQILFHKQWTITFSQDSNGAWTKNFVTAWKSALDLPFQNILIIRLTYYTMAEVYFQVQRLDMFVTPLLYNLFQWNLIHFHLHMKYLAQLARIWLMCSMMAKGWLWVRRIAHQIGTKFKYREVPVKFLDCIVHSGDVERLISTSYTYLHRF